jgi:S-adenosylhomocysteine hydrolase
MIKVRTMADAVHNYPIFLTRENKSKDYWEDINFMLDHLVKIFCQDGRIYLNSIRRGIKIVYCER